MPVAKPEKYFAFTKCGRSKNAKPACQLLPYLIACMLIPFIS